MSITLFLCYTREDEALLNKLKAQLRPLQRRGFIDVWYDRDINAGAQWKQEINQRLNTAQVILLLVSSDFMNSDYCYGIEMKRALERHERKEAIVIPIILRPVYWHGELFGRLQALPTDGKPITSASWHDQDEALYDVTRGIHKVVVQLAGSHVSPSRMVSEANQPSTLSDEARFLGSGSSFLTKRFSRRTVLGGVTALMVTGGGIVWWLSTPLSPSTPAPQIGTLLYTYTGHSGSVCTVAWSPDGKRIASGSKDHKVQVWNAADSTHLYTYTRHTDVVWTVAWSYDGKYIASGSQDKTVQIWNVVDDTHLYTYTGHSNWVRTVAWSPDSKHIASGGYDGTVQIWNAADGTHLYTYTGHSNFVFAAAWSPDGKRIASGSQDKTVQVWNATNGTHLYTYTGHNDVVYAVAWSPDGKYIASGSKDGTVQIWNATDGTHLYTYTGQKHGVATVAWSPTNASPREAQMVHRSGMLPMVLNPIPTQVTIPILCGQ